MLKNGCYLLLFVYSFLIVLSAQGQSKAVSELLVPAESAYLLVVSQTGSDLKLQISGGLNSEFTIDHPIGRTGPEIFLLDTQEIDRNYSISATEDGIEDLELQVIDISSDEILVSAAQLLTKAGQITPTATETLEQAIKYYSVVVDMGIQDYDLSDYARYLRAQLLRDNFRLDAALEDIISISGSFLGQYSYKLQWLEGQILFEKDDYQGAKDLLLEVDERISVISNDSPQGTQLDRAELRAVLGFAQALTGDIEQGKETLESSLAIALEHEHAVLSGEIHNNLGGFNSFLGKYREASVHFNAALDHLWNSGVQQSVVFTLSNMSRNYSDMGEFQLARDTAHMALLRTDEGFDASQHSAAYTTLTELYLSLGDYVIAEDFAKQTLLYDQETNRTWRTYTVINFEGDALLGQGRLDEAIEKYLISLEFFRENGPTGRYLSTLNRLANAQIKIGAVQAAQETLSTARAAVSLVPERSQSSSLRAVQLLEAGLLLERGEISASKELLTNLATSREDFATPEAVRITSLQMAVEEALGDSTSAIELGYSAVDLIKGIRSQLEFSSLGPSWNEETYPVYLTLTRLLIEKYQDTGNQYDLESAFNIAEEGIAYNFAQQWQSNRNAGFDVRENDELAGIRSELATLARARASNSNDDSYSETTLEYFKLKERYLAKVNTSTENVDLEIPTLEDVGNAIPGNAILIETLCVPEFSCYMFSVSPSGPKLTELGAVSDIEQLVSEINVEARKNNGNFSIAAQELGALLFSEFDLESIDQLYFIGTGPLAAIPLASLGDGNRNAYTPLISKVAIASLPSAAIARVEGAGHDREYSYDLAVLADPKFNAAQIVEGRVLARNADKLRGWYGELEALPWSALEAESLQDIYQGQKVKVMIGEEASKTRLLEESTRNSRIIHIASHGYFNSNTPDLVGIATSPEGDEPGFVTLDDLLLHPFNSELVVISGCETGLGESKGGEGMMSLSRSLLAQGSENVISTLWPVSDRASAEFMQIFYTSLHTENKAPAQALQYAQNEISRHPVFGNPFYWAAYVLSSRSY